jgi:6-pyruvoyltetrahydropterin/6-carboxytetrahydropterin synthase
LTLEFVRTVTFSAAHKYASPTLSLDENKRIYGSLYRDEGFGHNFLIEAHFTGPIDPLTGMIANLVDVDRWLKSVAGQFDHKFLNDLPEFVGQAPTLERIALQFFNLLVPALTPNVRLTQIRLYEGDQTWVDYFG